MIGWHDELTIRFIVTRHDGQRAWYEEYSVEEPCDDSSNQSKEGVVKMGNKITSMDRRSVLKKIGISTVGLSGITGLTSAKKGGRAVAYIVYTEDTAGDSLQEGEVFDLISRTGTTTVSCHQPANGHKVTKWQAFGSGPISAIYVQSGSLALEQRDLVKAVKIIGKCKRPNVEGAGHLTKVLIEEVDSYPDS